MVDKLRQVAAKEDDFNIFPYITHCTLDVICGKICRTFGLIGWTVKSNECWLSRDGDGEKRRRSKKNRFGLRQSRLQVTLHKLSIIITVRQVILLLCYFNRQEWEVSLNCDNSNSTYNLNGYSDWPNTGQISENLWKSYTISPIKYWTFWWPTTASSLCWLFFQHKTGHQRTKADTPAKSNRKRPQFQPIGQW